MKHKIYILAAGQADRWDGEIKQLADINGMPLIARTMRQLRGLDVTILTWRPEIKEIFPEITEEPENHEKLLDTVLSAEPEWFEYQRVTYLLGDVVYTAAAMEQILRSEKAVEFFASDQETFAFTFTNFYYDRIKAMCSFILSSGLKGTAWELYRSVVGIPIDKNWTDRFIHTRIYDQTDDIDYKDDYEQKVKMGYYETPAFTLPVLSILICHLESRADSFAELAEKLVGQIAGLPAEILVETDGGEMTVGEKRNRLLDRSKGEYICFIDDDDMVSKDYVTKITGALRDRPDCVSLTGLIYQGSGAKKFHHSIDYGWCEKEGVYYRSPNHLNPVKRELAMQIKFIHKDVSEDRKYSDELRPLLKKEGKTEGVIYHYKPNGGGQSIVGGSQ